MEETMATAKTTPTTVSMNVAPHRSPNASTLRKLSGWMFLAMAALCGSPVTLQAGEPEEFFKFYSWYQGKWQVEKEESGTKQTFTGKCEGSSGGCNIWVDKSETSIWGYDPKTKQWTGVGQLDNGSRYLRVITRPPAPAITAGVKFTFKCTTWNADGTVHYETIKFTCIDANTSRSVITRIDQDGKQLPTITTVAKRIK